MPPSEPFVILIGPRDRLPPIQARLSDSGLVRAFGSDDVLMALEIIVSTVPAIVAVERTFAQTSRGAALITRIKGDPRLARTQVRVMAHDSDYMRVSPRRRQTSPREPAGGGVPLDPRGTREVPRREAETDVRVTVDRETVILVDLSEAGAQVVTTSPLRPRQRVRITLSRAASEEPASVTDAQLDAEVTWVNLEIVEGQRQYRAGLMFSDDDPAVVRFVGGGA